MIAAAIVLAVILLIVLIAFLPVGVVAEYAEGGITVDVSAGPFLFRVFPPDERKKQKKRMKKAEAKKEKKPGAVKKLKLDIHSILRAVQRVRRRLTIRELKIYYQAAGEDAAATALAFGGASIGYGFIIPLLENNFKIKKRDLRASFNFQAAEPMIYVRAKLTVALWELIYALFGILPENQHNGEQAPRKNNRKAV